MSSDAKQDEVYSPNAERAVGSSITSLEQYREMWSRSVGPDSDPFWQEVRTFRGWIFILNSVVAASGAFLV
jgi:hypothetical protein